MPENVCVGAPPTQTVILAKRDTVAVTAFYATDQSEVFPSQFEHLNGGKR